MKILCNVNDKPAVVVGFATGKKNRPLAVCICEGKMVSVRLKDVQLRDLPEALQSRGKVLQMPAAKKEA